MKIILATVGSRGDVQPMLALSLALQDRGHDVLLAGPPERAGWAVRLGCPYAPLGRDVTAFIDAGPSTRTPSAVAAFYRYVRQEIREQFRVLPGLIAGADLVVGASLCFGLSSVAEAMQIPYRYIAFTPQLLPSGHHPCPIFKFQQMPVRLNRIGWWWAIFMDRFNTTQLINQYRRKLGLASVRAAHVAYLGRRVIVASDRALGAIPPDVRIKSVQTGYMHLGQPVPHLPALEQFLANGPPPVYVGFGSMPRADQAALVPVIEKAAKFADRRVVIARPWGGIPEISPGRDLFFVRHYPHEALFPRMAAVVHHGGAGTTATAAASGVPQIIVPHILDQYFWGDRVFQAGIGAKAIWRSRLTGQRLGRAIQACVGDSAMRQNAVAVRDAISRQDGVGMTVEELLRGP